MKKIFLVAALAAFGTNVMAQAPQAPVTPVIKVDPSKAPKFSFPKGTMHDFGTIEEGPQVTYVFEFKNTGKTPLIIQTANAECGCTTPEFDKEPVKPGKTGKITVRYNTIGRPGGFQKNVWITSNAALAEGQDRQQLIIKGTVNPKPATPATVTPAGH